jgi:hypothetical protein
MRRDERRSKIEGKGKGDERQAWIRRGWMQWVRSNRREDLERGGKGVPELESLMIMGRARTGPGVPSSFLLNCDEDGNSSWERGQPSARSSPITVQQMITI